MTNKEKIMSLNPRLFEGSIAPEKFVPILVAKSIKADGEGKSKLQFIHTTQPTEKAKAAGVKPQRYLRVQMLVDGIVKTVGERKEIRSKKKPYAHNIFANSQPILFGELSAIVEEYENAETPEEKARIMKRKGKTADNKGWKYEVQDIVLYGKYISMNVPKYVPQERDPDTGLNKDFSAIRRDPKTGEYKRDRVVMSVARFWADEDDLEELETICETIYENQVMPFETGETVIQNIKGNTTTVVKEEATVTPPEEIETNEGGEEDEPE